jgi:hypothetical protein
MIINNPKFKINDQLTTDLLYHPKPVKVFDIRLDYGHMIDGYIYSLIDSRDCTYCYKSKFLEEHYRLSLEIKLKNLINSIGDK